jgi:hypothetical protein
VNLASRRSSDSTSNLRSYDSHRSPAPQVAAQTSLGPLRRQSAYFGAIQPVILVKLGPTTDNVPAFCWSHVGETTEDMTIAYPGGIMLPETIVESNVTGADDDNTRRRYRALRAGETDHSTEHSAEYGVSESDDSGEGDSEQEEDDDPASWGPPDGATDGDVEHSKEPTLEPTAFPGAEKGETERVEGATTLPTPTAHPTFLEGPRKYVHWGHPKCFAFGWETMPPQDSRRSAR